jgi:hypothetical protein
MREDDMKASNLKSASELTLDDFSVHPIWTWAESDEDESLVMPLDYSGALPEDHDALFVACELLLVDNTKIAGVISVRMSDYSVYLLSFSKADRGFFDFPLHPQLTTVTREQLANQLGKRAEHIFPIRYNTSYTFIDGRLLAGQIE